MKDFSMSYHDVLNLPYITFVIGMLDTPSIDYEEKKKNKKKKSKPFGTPLNELSLEDQKNIK